MHMSKRYMRKPEYVSAYQWFEVSEYRQGYKREVEEYRRHPNCDGITICKSCGKALQEHGYMDPPVDCIVCPGDWIVTKDNGKQFVCDRILFESQFEPVANDMKGRNEW